MRCDRPVVTRVRTSEWDLEKIVIVESSLHTVGTKIVNRIGTFTEKSRHIENFSLFNSVERFSNIFGGVARSRMASITKMSRRSRRSRRAKTQKKPERVPISRLAVSFFRHLLCHTRLNGPTCTLPTDSESQTQPRQRGPTPPPGHKKKGTLAAGRIQELQDLGFAWNTDRTRRESDEWMAKLETLRRYEMSKMQFLPSKPDAGFCCLLTRPCQTPLSQVQAGAWTLLRTAQVLRYPLCRMDPSTADHV